MPEMKDKSLNTTHQRIVMLGTSPETPGGVASVIKVYKRAGLFQRWPIIYLPTHCDGAKWLKMKMAVSALFRFLYLLTSGQVQIVHLHVASRASFWRKSLFIALASLFRKSVIFHLHGAEFRDFYFKECGYLKKRIIKLLLNNVDQIVVLSPRWINIMSEITENPSIECIFNPVEIPDIGVCQRINNQLLFLGQMGKRKGIFDILEALPQLREEFQGLKLICGGDGDAIGVEKRARELGLNENIDIRGWIGSDEKQQLLRESTMLILPSYNEGLPMSVLEAMAYGLPVIATPVGGIPDAIEDNVEGLLVPPGDIEKLAQATRTLLRNPSLRERMGKAAFKKALEQFNVEQVLNKLGETYSRAGFINNSTGNVS